MDSDFNSVESGTTGLHYRGDELFFGGELRLDQVIRDHGGLACYVYSLGSLQARCERLKKSLQNLKNLKIHYAIKANSNERLLRRIKKLELGVDVVSSGEMRKSFDCGFEPWDVIFSGVGKTPGEINLAIKNRIKQINVESPQELERIGRLAEDQKQRVNVGLRMNPDVNPLTHPYITTGMGENKFGMDESFIPALVKILRKYKKSLYLRGLSMHIGSQIVDLSAIEEAGRKLLFIYQNLEKLGFKMESIDFGGGVGIHYQKKEGREDFKTMESYGQILESLSKDFKGEVLIEPGRVLVARCGVLLCQVEYTKETSRKNFAILNTGMHHFIRPALYRAEHRVLPLKKNKKSPRKVYDLAGPICESSDFLARSQLIQSLSQGDFLCICDTGAYGYSMASHYNMHEFPKEFVFD